MSDTLIKVEGVSKKFCKSLKKSLWYGMQDLGREITGRKHGGDGELRPDEFWAVNDVSFELKRGECLGLIGRNGAGKTTLLRMLNGLIKPDRGRIEMRGRVGALIALGAGFNPILTGRENIYVNASVLGLRKSEIDAKIGEIIDFAEIGDFIDTPVQSYSSGMQVRLGFSIASSICPDVLLLDEVLAVGDLSFRMRCYRRIDELREHAAVILVSHDMSAIKRVCDKAILLDKGHVYAHDNPEVVIPLIESRGKKNLQTPKGTMGSYYPIHSLQVSPERQEITSGTKASIEVTIDSEERVPEYALIISAQDSTETHVAECIIKEEMFSRPLIAGHNRLKISFLLLPLKAGEYNWNVSLIDQRRSVLAYSRQRSGFRILSSFPTVNLATCILPLDISEDLIKHTNSTY